MGRKFLISSPIILSVVLASVVFASVVVEQRPLIPNVHLRIQMDKSVYDSGSTAIIRVYLVNTGATAVTWAQSQIEYQICDEAGSVVFEWGSLISVRPFIIESGSEGYVGYSRFVLVRIFSVFGRYVRYPLGVGKYTVKVFYPQINLRGETFIEVR